MTLACLRIETYQESEEFSGKVFTWEDYLEWFIKMSHNFSFLDEWADGLNLPFSSLKPFYEGRFDPLWRNEQKFLDLFRGKSGDFAIICLGRKASWTTFKHELVHAFFMTDGDYQEAVERAVNSFPTKKIRGALKKLDYGESAMCDEINAYVLTGLSPLYGVSERDVRRLRRTLRQIFFDYFGFRIEKVTKKDKRLLLDVIHVMDFK